MRRVGRLFEKVVAFPNLLWAARRASRGKRGRPEVARFMADLEPELFRLQEELGSGTWRPGPFRTFHIRDPKPRVISAAPFSDRVVHHALMRVLDPVFESYQVATSFACRRGKGTHRAVMLARRYARRWSHVLKGDVEAFFETVDHAVLKELLRRKLKDRRVLRLLDTIIDGPAPPAAAEHSAFRIPHSSFQSRGLPIGNLTSQYLANHYLGVLDHFVKEQLRVRGYLRYMDDFLLFGDDRAEVHRHRAAIRELLAARLELELKEGVTRVQRCSRGIPFLGFAVYPGIVRLRGETARRMRRRVRRREAEHRAGTLPEERLAASVGASVAHAGHGSTLGLRRAWFGFR